MSEVQLLRNDIERTLLKLIVHAVHVCALNAEEEESESLKQNNAVNGPQPCREFNSAAGKHDERDKTETRNDACEHAETAQTRLYIGIAFYKVGEPSKNEPDWTVQGGVPELKKQLDLNDSLPNVNGTILFREDYLNQPQTQEAVSYLRGRWGS